MWSDVIRINIKEYIFSEYQFKHLIGMAQKREHANWLKWAQHHEARTGGINEITSNDEHWMSTIHSSTENYHRNYAISSVDRHGTSR